MVFTAALVVYARLMHVSSESDTAGFTVNHNSPYSPYTEGQARVGYQF